ncbi:uncharacterized protein LOC143292682 [Babylonia areolata]|uniref:uncharacterized protein LOC143292682 n=1 Tax=Babylonia areolata TaxID=304850 RepID=UPI003FD3FF6E
MLCKPIRRRSRRRPPQPHQSHDRLVWASRKNVVIAGVPDRGRRYLSDFYTTLIDIQWRWNLLFFVVGFVLTWLVFALYYYLLCFLHGDLDPGHGGHNATWTPCVENVKTFTQAYLFSIETMSTIGYGWRHQTEECPGVYMAVMVQSVIGAGLQFALASLVVSKTRRANRISQTILFSNTAVIYPEDGRLRLAVRIGDMRKGDVIGAHATGMLIKKTTMKAGHRVPVRMFTVPFEAEGGRQKLFLCWPCLLIHQVDQHSPFWTLSRDDLLHHQYELIVILDGVAATTSKPFQARKSYHSWEILWGRRFKSLTITHDDLNSSGYVVNYTTFHHTYPAPAAFCSAQVLERKRLFRELNAEYQDQDLNVTAESFRRGDSDRPASHDRTVGSSSSESSDMESSDGMYFEKDFSAGSEEEEEDEGGEESHQTKPASMQTAKSEQTETLTEASQSKEAESSDTTELEHTDPADSPSTSPDQTRHSPLASIDSLTRTQTFDSQTSNQSTDSPTSTSDLPPSTPDQAMNSPTSTPDQARCSSQTPPRHSPTSTPDQAGSSSQTPPTDSPASNQTSDLSTPTRTRKSSTPTRTRKSSAPNRTRKSSVPTRYRKSSAPIQAGPVASTPTRYRKSSAPIQTSPVASTPTRYRKSSAPTVTRPYVLDPTQPEHNNDTSTPAKDRVRKMSRVEFEPLPFLKGTTPGERRLSLGDALNLYRHRRSVTDTYLGTELPEEDSEDDAKQANAAALLSLLSQQQHQQQQQGRRRSDGRPPDMRDVFKFRRKSTTLPLMFATEAGDRCREAQSS